MNVFGFLFACVIVLMCVLGCACLNIQLHVLFFVDLMQNLIENCYSAISVDTAQLVVFRAPDRFRHLFLASSEVKVT